jgi:alkylation response protein AidB-like acyl-CoA dehydrogenase
MTGGGETETVAAVLERTRALTGELLRPRAAESDQALGPPAENLRALARVGVMGLTVPAEYGGADGSPGEVRRALEIVASGCGVTAFVLFQHLVGCRHLAGSANEGLKEVVLPPLATGERFCSLAFSHLRRPGPPAVRVEPVEGGWRFDGTAPWMTGWGYADECLLAGTLPDGDSVWVMTALAERPGLRASPPMRLCAANASATVALELDGLFVPMERHVKRLTPAQLAGDTAGAILFFTALSLGAAVGAVEVIRARADAAGSGALARAAASFEREIREARAETDACAERPDAPDFLARAVEVRAACIELGVRAAHAAVVASSGAANGLDHPAQRLFREAMLYTLTAQTRELQSAMLERLTRG